MADLPKGKSMIEKPPVQHWRQYKEAVYKHHLTPHQEKECSGCFFAGMAVAYDCITTMPDLPEDECVKLLEQLEKQIKVTALANINTGEN